MRIAKFLALGLLISVVAAGGAYAFHDAGVAECAGCHTMHNSQDGALVDTLNATGNAYLLMRENSTDTCLRCHAAYGQMRNGEGFGPGGDFYWVTKDFTWSAHGHAYASTGDSHGHNVISPYYGIAEDATLGQAPGGTFDATYLTCTSCHDPHGNTNFRLLYGTALGPIYPLAPGGRFSFTEGNAPLAWGNSRNTYTSDGEETDSHHTLYKSGMSDWCSNCHVDIHSGNTTNSVHPTGQGVGASIAAVYNAYQGSTAQGGNQATAYWGLVPFEDVDADTSLGYGPDNYTMGPDAADQVMCLTCHRSHASAFPDIARWDMGETFMVDSHPQLTDGGATADDVARKFYNYTFFSGDDQRSLCNKCHFKDQFDAGY
jgi:hypothetical protein